MGLSKALAVKLLHLSEGGQMPASKLAHALVLELISEGVIKDQRSGRSKSLLSLPAPESLDAFLLNRFGIINLANYIDALNQEELTRSVLVRHSTDSKINNVRVFKGFLVNSYEPIPAQLEGKNIIIHPPVGTFQFIHRFERFIPEPDVTIIGIENSENFSQINKQRYLFKDRKALFISRYPQNQSKDLVRWLMGIPNIYLHFGDYDFAGINIYMQEYKRHLGARARFFVPTDLELLLARYGNRKLYDIQQLNHGSESIDETELLQVISLLHRYKKGLEQEALIQDQTFV